MQGLLWPVHPQFLAGEALSSWMVRLAHRNGFKVHTFFAEYLGREREIWTRDVDHFAPAWLTSALQERTGAKAATIAAGTLRSYEGWVFEKFNETGNTRWVMPLSVYHRTRRSYGQQFCPVCLALDATPYLRLRWRLSFLTACAEHGVLLEDRCRSCGKSVSPHRLDMACGRTRSTRITMRWCAHCRADLAGPGVKVGSGELAHQQRLQEALQLGVADIAGRQIYLHLYLDGLRLMMKGLRRGTSGSNGGRFNFARLPANERTTLLHEAMQELEDWPHGFLERARQHKRQYSHFVHDVEPAPWWLWSVLRRSLFSAPAAIDPRESRAILDATEQIVGKRSGFHARRLFGRDVAGEVDITSEGEVDALIAGIDRSYVQASERMRPLLLRDKVMFLVGRRRRLSMPELTALKMESVEPPNGAVEGLWRNASEHGDVERVIAWYVHKVRPALKPSTDSDALFISHGGAGITANAVGERLKVAVKTAQLRSGLASWSAWVRHHSA